MQQCEHLSQTHVHYYVRKPRATLSFTFTITRSHSRLRVHVTLLRKLVRALQEPKMLQLDVTHAAQLSLIVVLCTIALLNVTFFYLNRSNKGSARTKQNKTKNNFVKVASLCISILASNDQSVLDIHIYVHIPKRVIRDTQHEYQERLKLQVYHFSRRIFAASNAQTSFLSTEGSAYTKRERVNVNE